jgi:hypothetical protein
VARAASVRLDDVIYEARLRRYITRRRLDLDPDVLSAYGSDWFEFKNDGWRLEHRSGIYTYKERANGLAILNVPRMGLPELVCSSLAGRMERLDNVIKVDPACVASECEGQITSAANRTDGSVDFRLRVKWIDTFTQQ